MNSVKRDSTPFYMTSRLQKESRPTASPNAPVVYPFAAIVGQEEMKVGLILNAIDPLLGGVLIMGHRGTGKSTAVRALGELLPQISVVTDCLFSCDPGDSANFCESCESSLSQPGRVARHKRPVAVVELPLGATEDRVCGSIDIQRALTDGTKSFEPGLLARANRGFLYIDEVNLLEDHLVDLLLDVAATGRHKVERESISVEHPAQFVLIGSGNPEEGELRPQLLDRFGLHVEVLTENDLDRRVEIVERRQSFETDRAQFLSDFAEEQSRLRSSISRARRILPAIKLERGMLRKIAELCSELRLDGHRGELTITRAARAFAALESRRRVSESDVRKVTPMALRHRLRREPFEETGSHERIERALDKIFDGTKSGDRSDDGPAGNGFSSQEPGGSDRSEKARAKSRATGSAASATDRKSRQPDQQNLESRLSPVKKDGLAQADFERLQTAGRNRNSDALRGRRNRSGKRVLNNERGRYSWAVYSEGSHIAVDATMRALAASNFVATDTTSTPNTQHPLPFPLSALRYKQFSRKRGSLYILAIDASGSMAPRRISRAREVALGLLRDAYIRRDCVAIVVFRGAAAEVVLPPSRSILRAKRALDCLTIGGGTPLSAGVLCSLQLAKQSRAQHGEPVVLLFTDGHANVSLRSQAQSDRSERNLWIGAELSELGRALKQAGVTAFVVDVQDSFSSIGDAQAVADKLGSKLIKIDANQRSEALPHSLR